MKKKLRNVKREEQLEHLILTNIDILVAVGPSTSLDCNILMLYNLHTCFSTLTEFIACLRRHCLWNFHSHFRSFIEFHASISVII